jgi:hypothetical protein
LQKLTKNLEIGRTLWMNDLSSRKRLEVSYMEREMP